MRGRDVAIGAGAALLLAWLIGGRGPGFGGPGGSGGSTPGTGGGGGSGGGPGASMPAFVIRTHGTQCTVGGNTSSGQQTPDPIQYVSYEQACTLALTAVAANPGRKVEVFTANGQQDRVTSLLACLRDHGTNPIQVDL